MSEVNEDYWYNQWHLDTNLHNILKIKNVTKIPDTKSVSVYGDSISGDSMIKTNIGEMTIDELFSFCDGESDRTDKEVLKCDLFSLNWSEDKKIHFSKIKNVIRHKVSKKKWKIRVEGKEIIVTNDHSLVVFRDNKKLVIPPYELKITDKIITI